MSNPLCGGTSAPHLSFFTADVVVTVREGGRRPWLLDAIDQDTVDELVGEADQALDPGGLVDRFRIVPDDLVVQLACHRDLVIARFARSEENTSKLQSLMRISHTVFC